MSGRSLANRRGFLGGDGRIGKRYNPHQAIKLGKTRSAEGRWEEREGGGLAQASAIRSVIERIDYDGPSGRLAVKFRSIAFEAICGRQAGEQTHAG